MPLFRTNRQLPTTSYGYQPPPDAIAVGWRCNSSGCGRASEPGAVPRSWPFRCPGCGQPVDARLADPWAHDARGVELRHAIATDSDMREISEYALPAWQYKDAMARGNRDGAIKARAEFRAYDDAHPDGNHRAFGYSELLRYALDAGDVSGAADDLLHWLETSVADGSYRERADCKQAIGRAVEYLEVPGAFDQPAASAILSRAFELGAAAEEYLSHPTVVGLKRLRDR